MTATERRRRRSPGLDPGARVLGVMVVVLLVARLLPGGVTFQLSDVAARPGEAGIRVPVTLVFEDGDPPVQGWEIHVRYDPAVVEDVVIESTLEADFINHPNPSLYEDPGIVGLAVVFVLTGPEEGRLVTSTAVVANLHLCLKDAAPVGPSPLEILPQARRTRGAPFLSTVYTANSASHVPVMLGGVVTVAGEPVSEECTREPPPPPPPDPPPLPPRPWTASFALASAAAVRGGEVAIPFTVRGNAEVRGFSFSIDFDETLLQASGIENLIVKPDGAEPDLLVLGFNNDDHTPGSSGIDEGYFAGGIVLSLDDPFDYYLARDTDHAVVVLELQVKEDAPVTTTEIAFIDGGRPVPAAQPAPNVVTIVSESVDPEPFDSVLFINAGVEIVGDASAFRRGDANGNGALELSDAQHTLNFLFLGGPAPRCRDAADVTDDGSLNVTDPVRLLNYLFLGGPAPPFPHAEADFDPTPDELDCEEGLGTP